MMENAKWREEERLNILKRHAEDDEREQRLETLGSRDGKFIQWVHLPAAERLSWLWSRGGSWFIHCVPGVSVSVQWERGDQPLSHLCYDSQHLARQWDIFDLKEGEVNWYFHWISLPSTEIRTHGSGGLFPMRLYLVSKTGNFSVMDVGLTNWVPDGVHSEVTYMGLKELGFLHLLYGWQPVSSNSAK